MLIIFLHTYIQIPFCINAKFFNDFCMTLKFNHISISVVLMLEQSANLNKTAFT